jgi:hypothetical protein
MMPTSVPPQLPRVNPGNIAKWNDEQRQILIEAMHAELSHPNYCYIENGFRKDSWIRITKSFNARNKIQYDSKQLQSQRMALKHRFDIFNTLKNTAGNFEF